jgi:hypothetical protein
MGLQGGLRDRGQRRGVRNDHDNGHNTHGSFCAFGTWLNLRGGVMSDKSLPQIRGSERGDEPAFPMFGDLNATLFANGLSKRELFAAMAMHGLLQCAAKDELDPTEDVRASADAALELADALLAALEESK